MLVNDKVHCGLRALGKGGWELGPEKKVGVILQRAKGAVTV